MKRTSTLALLTLLVGCTSTPIARFAPAPKAAPTAATATRAKAPPLPPMPPGFVVGARAATTPPRLAVIVPTDPSVQIGVWDATHYYVLGIQTNAPGGSMQFSLSPLIAGPWDFIADPGWLAQGETAMVFIPRDWLPQHQLFTSVRIAPSPQPVGAMAAARTTDSGKTFVRKGKRYRLMQVPSPLFPVYRLVP